MKLFDILQGKWLGHPLHPALVHLPLGLWLVAPVLDLVAWYGVAEPVLARLSLACVGVGLLTALLAVPTGVADWTSIKKEKPAWKLGLYHMLLNLLAALVWAGNCGLRLDTPERGAEITLPILLTAALGAGLVFIGGYLGCRLAFDHGVSVARQSKAKWRALAERGGARVPEA